MSLMALPVVIPILILMGLSANTSTKMKSNLALAIWAAVSVALSNVPAGSVSAQNLPDVNARMTEILPPPRRIILLDKVSRRGFESCFQTISRLGGMTIIAEGAPLHVFLTEPQIENLNSVLPSDIPLSAREVTSRLAAAFDYDAEWLGSDLVLLHKRYSDPADLPCVTLGEIEHSLKSVLETTAVYEGNSPRWGPQSAECMFINSLSDDQLKVAGNGIAFAALSQEQMQLAVAAADYLFLSHETHAIRETFEQIQTLVSPNTSFEWLKIQDERCIGYVCPTTTLAARRGIAIGHFLKTQAGTGLVHVINNASLGNAQQLDTDIPTDDDRRLAKGMMADRLSCTDTLDDAVLTLLKFSANSKKIVKVDPDVAGKPVSIFGPNFCSVDHFVRGLATLYGLKLLVPSEGHYTVTLPSPRPTNGIGDVPEEVNRIFPLSLKRAIAAQVEAEVRVRLGKTVSATPENSTRSSMKDRISAQAMLKIRTEAAKAYYFTALRRLLLLLTPSLPSKDSKPVLASGLDPEVLRLTALAMLSGIGLDNALNLATQQVQSSIIEPSKLWLWAQKDSKSMLLGLGDGQRNSQGRIGSYLLRIVPIKEPTIPK